MADRCCKSFQSAVRPFEEPRRLIDVPYRFSRNPMYLGMLPILAGAAPTLLGSLGPIVVAWLITIQFHVEERMLEAHFGDVYRRYKSRVRRWL